MQFLQEGGWGAYLVLILSLVTLVDAALFAWKPDRKRLAFLVGMTVATLLSSMTGTVAGLASTFHYVGDPAKGGAGDWPHMLLLGLGESLGSLILGFGLMAVAWILGAVGLRRLQQG